MKSITLNAPTRMKRFTAAIVLLSVFWGGCKLDETNVNPNVPVDVPMETLLPPAQFGFARALGGRCFRYTNIFTQHLRGTNNQELAIENYAPDELFVGYMWEDFYTGPMVSLKILIDKAKASESPHYVGVGRVLMANALGVVTDIWGDVPYSEALDPSNVTPVYDSQAFVYEQIIDLLDQAIIDLQAAESVFSPGNDDIIYQG
ncbi:MAG: SusD/RagB family nutrient-binding outer membrane lipoprotein, partial [Flavobacteriales bacterium]